MIVTYWGVRGSIPVPGLSTVRYGGNTSCVTVEAEGGLLVLDAGTGILALGDRLGAEPGEVEEVVLLLTHRHGDHVQGLPFFAPLFGGRLPVLVPDYVLTGGEAWTPLDLLDGISVPMRPEQLAASVRRVGSDVRELLGGRGIELSTLPLNHPGGAYGYRVRGRGKSFAHLTDNDLGEREGEFFAGCVDFCRGVDVLSHDAQYLDEERGWSAGRGHSTIERVCDLAEEAGVGHLVLFHHDPHRSDAELERLEQWARARLGGAGIDCSAAYEGLAIEL